MLHFLILSAINTQYVIFAGRSRSLKKRQSSLEVHLLISFDQVAVAVGYAGSSMFHIPLPSNALQLLLGELQVFSGQKRSISIYLPKYFILFSNCLSILLYIVLYCFFAYGIYYVIVSYYFYICPYILIVFVLECTYQSTGAGWGWNSAWELGLERLFIRSHDGHKWNCNLSIYPSIHPSIHPPEL